MTTNVNFNRFPTLGDDLQELLSEAVTTTVFAGVGNVRAHIAGNGQIDTGFMYDAVYGLTWDTSTYGQGGSGGPGQELLAQVPGPTDNVTGSFAAGASYSAFQNYGTRYLPPRPFWEPGTQDTVADYADAIAEIPDKLEARNP